VLHRRNIRRRCEQLHDRSCALGISENKDLFDPGLVCSFDGVFEELRDGQKEARLRVIELEGKLVRRIERVDGSDDAADRYDAVERNCVLRQVGHVYGKALAFAETSSGKPGSKSLHLPDKLRVVDRSPGRPID